MSPLLVAMIMVSHCSAAVCVDPGVAMSKDHGGGDLCVI